MTMVYLALECVDQLLDLAGGDGVQGGAGLVHEEDLGLHGQGPGDAQPLLLPAGEAEAALVKPVLHLIPEGGRLQTPLHGFVHPRVVDTEDPESVGHVLVDGLGEGVGLLKDHAHPLPQFRDVHLRIVDVPAVDADGPGEGHVIDEVVQPVETSQEGGLPAARGADERGGLPRRDVQVDVEEGLFLTVLQVHPSDLDHRVRHGRHLRMRDATSSFGALASNLRRLRW